MYTEISCKHTSLKQCGQKPAYNDLTQFLLTRIVRLSLSISFNPELVPVNVTVHMKLNLHFIFHVFCCSLQNKNNFGETRSMIRQELEVKLSRE